MIPPEVAAALRLVNNGKDLEFGNKAQIGAIAVLQKWVDAPCKYCEGGITQSSAGRYPCHVCEGSGKIWIRR